MILLRRTRRLYSTCHCWSTTVPACPRCSSISPLPANTTHHELLGISQKPNPFVIDLADLKNRFRAAQASVHPDVWAAKPPREQDLAHTLSSRVNEAYQTLLNPLARAEYILRLNGHALSEHDQVHDLEFMSTIMEARELIDDADDPTVLERVRRDNEEDIKTTVSELGTLIEQKKWPDAKHAAIRLRYLDGIKRAIVLRNQSL